MEQQTIYLTIKRTEEIKKGLFLQSPIFDDYFDHYNYGGFINPTFPLYAKHIQKKFNKKDEEALCEGHQLAGMYFTNVRFPITTKRVFRNLTVKGFIKKNDEFTKVLTIKSNGHNVINEVVSGDCSIEKTSIDISDKIIPERHKTKFKRTDGYKFTYESVVVEYLENMLPQFKFEIIIKDID